MVYTAERDPEFRKRWEAYDGSAERVAEFAGMMEKAGAPEYLQEKSQNYIREARETLELHRTDNEFQQILDEAIDAFADRNV